MLLLKLLDLSAGEDSGIPSVAVECVDIRRNISGEGDYLDSPLCRSQRNKYPAWGVRPQG